MAAVITRLAARTGASEPTASGTRPRRGSAVRGPAVLGPAVLVCALALASCAAPALASDKDAQRVIPVAVLGSTAVDPVLPKASDVKALSAIGEHKAVVFSPDFTMPSNRAFWEKLGFFYVEDASWERVVSEIERFNAENPDRAVETVFITSHGANGNGLKLQAGHESSDPRSYASIGGLQERFGKAGVKRFVVAACNTSRLFRPDVYSKLDRDVSDPLFLPATLGYVEASEGFDPRTSSVLVIRRADNQKENTSEGTAAELSPATRRQLGLADAASARGMRFVVSDLFVQMITGDPKLRLTASGYVTRVELTGADNERSDRYYRGFVRTLDAIASR